MHTATTATPLPAEIAPPESSTDLLRKHVERRNAAGVANKAIAFDAGFSRPNVLSMLQSGSMPLPMQRILSLAQALRLSASERHELVHARLMEMHAEGKICVEAITEWASDLLAPSPDQAVLLELWAQAVAPSPMHAAGLLADPAAQAKVAAVLQEIAQGHFRALAEDSHPAH